MVIRLEGVKTITLEEQLKSEILSRYKSVRAFTTAIGIPYSTLDSVFKRGVTNAGIGTMLKVFSALDLDIESIQTEELKRRSPETKRTPAPPSGGTGVRVDPEKLQDMLIEFGFIKHGEDLSDSDFRFLFYIGEIISAWIAEKE